MEDRDFDRKGKKGGKTIAIIAVICILIIASLFIILKVTGKKGEETKVSENDFSSGVVVEDIDQNLYNSNGIEKTGSFNSKAVSDSDSFGFTEYPDTSDGSIDFESLEKNGIVVTDNESQLDGMEDSYGTDFDDNIFSSNSFGVNDFSDDQIEKGRLSEIESFAESESKRLEEAERQQIADSERRKLEEVEKQAQAERQRIADAEKKRLAAAEKAEADEAARLAAVEKSIEEDARRRAEAERARAEEASKIAKEKAKAEEDRRLAEAKKAKEEEARRIAEAEKAAADAERRANEKAKIAEAEKQKSAESYKNRNNTVAQNNQKNNQDDKSVANNVDYNKNRGTDNLDSAYGNNSLSPEDQKMFNELNQLFSQYENADSNSDKQAVLAKALPISEKIINSGKKNPKAHFFASRDDYNNRRYNDAIAELNKSISMEENYLYYHELGKLRYMSKDYNGAIAAFKKACQLNANFAPSRYNLGLSLVKVNKIDQGLSCYKQAVAINPDYVQAHLGMARLYKQVRYYNDAIKSYKRAIEIDPKNIPARMDLGVIYNERGDFDNAIAVYNDALKYLSESEMQTIIKYNLSIALFNNGDYEKALEVAKESYDEKDYLKDASSKSNVVYNYGLILETVGETKDAIAMYKEAISIYKAHIKAKVNLSAIYMKQESPDMEEIFRLLNEAYVVAPFNFEVNNNMGNAYVLNGDYNTAIVYFETALDANPKDEVVKQNLANAYLKAEDYENAEMIYLEILDSDSKNWQANLDLAKVYIQLNDRDSAEKYLKFIKNNKPDFKPEEVNGLLGAL